LSGCENIRKYLILGVLFLAIASAGCTGGSSEPPETTQATTTAPATTSAPAATEAAVEYTILYFYDPIDDAYVDGKIYIDYAVYGNSKDGQIKIQHKDIPEKETTQAGEPKYDIEFEGVIKGNPTKKKWTLTQTELFSPEQTLEVREKMP
jgi:hypothetical protein